MAAPISISAEVSLILTSVSTSGTSICRGLWCTSPAVGFYTMFLVFWGCMVLSTTLLAHITSLVSSTFSCTVLISKKYFRPGAMAPSEPSETPSWRFTPRPASIQRVTFHITIWSLFHRSFSFCRFPFLNDHAGVVANCDHTSEWVHWVRACIGIPMGWVTLRQSLLAFLVSGSPFTAIMVLARWEINTYHCQVICIIPIYGKSSKLASCIIFSGI